MPNPFESLPDTSHTLGFPSGDISIADAASSTAVLEELMQGDIETQREAILELRDTEIEDWRLLPGQEENYKALMHLTEAWADTTATDYREQDLASVGAFSMLAYIKRSELITVEFSDLSNELDVMSEFDEEAITAFAYESWPNIGKTHPHLFNELFSFIMHLESVNDIRSEDDAPRNLQGAAAVLPYLMANTTELLSGLDSSISDDELFIK